MFTVHRQLLVKHNHSGWLRGHVGFGGANTSAKAFAAGAKPAFVGVGALAALRHVELRRALNVTPSTHMRGPSPPQPSQQRVRAFTRVAPRVQSEPPVPGAAFDV